MPRTARLDSPGVLHHVRGGAIQRRRIFLNDFDRQDFVQRLEYACSDGAATLYAWSLMPNHFHLAIRTGSRPLSTTMKKVLGAYATSFNRRNNRAGHLFQNRYKSTVVDEEQYLLSLIRYIHLNPIRAKLIDDMDALRTYPFCGHHLLMGKNKMPCMAVDEILARFAPKTGPARRQIVSFMKATDAKKEGQVFKAGGLVRRVGGSKALKELSQNEKLAYDKRILGTESFVESILQKTECESQSLALPIEEREQRFVQLALQICKQCEISVEELTSGSRRRALVKVRRAVCYLSVRKLGLTCAFVSQQLNISAVSVLKGVDTGLEAINALDLKEDTLMQQDK